MKLGKRRRNVRSRGRTIPINGERPGIDNADGRNKLQSMATIPVAGHTVDLARRLLLDAEGQRVELRAQALELLCLLAERAGEVVDKRSAIDRVWPGMVVTDDSLVQAIGDIRQAIGDAKHVAIQTVPRRGYRLIADQPASELPESSVPPSTPAKRWQRPWALAATAALLLGTAIGAAAWWTNRSPLERLGQPVIAVLAFRDLSAQAGDNLLGEGLAEELIGDLARDVDLPVVSGRSSFQLDLQKVAAPEVAKRLNVRYLIDGSVRRQGEQFAIRAQLIDGSDGRIVWTHDASAGAAELDALRQALVERMAGSVRVSLWQLQKQRALARPAASLDAHALALRTYAAKHQFNGPAYRIGRAAGEEAIRLDPNNAFAWAALGYLNSLDAGNGFTGEWTPDRRGEALVQIDRALQLDPQLPLAHQARAVTLRAMNRVPEALRAAETAVRLAPGDADNVAILAFVRVAVGRVDDARAAIDKALPMFPIPPAYVTLFDAEVRWAARDFERALAQANDCLERAPRYSFCRFVRMMVLAEMGRLDEAQRDAAHLREQVPKALAGMSKTSRGAELDARRDKVLEMLGVAAAN